MKYLLVFIVSMTVLGCTQERAGDHGPSGAIRIAVLPDQSRDRLSAKYSSLLEYLGRATALEYELVIPSDYPDLVDRFNAGDIDLAWFGGLTFAQANASKQAVPVAFRDVDLQFTSCYLAKASDTRTDILDFAGERFTFGPDLSTSGHLMPRYFMTEDGIDPEKLFASIQHSAGHDQTAIWVSNGNVALGVANCIIVQSLFESGVLKDDEIQIIATTPPYPDYVWAASPSMDEQTRISILNALLALDATVSEHRAILRSQGANAYLPAGSSDFEMVRMAAIQAGVLTPED